VNLPDADHSEVRMTSLENRLAAELCMQAHVSMWACDEESRIVLWNRGAEEIYGYPAEDVIGKRFFELFVDEAERETSQADTVRTITTGVRQRNLLAYDHDPSDRVRYMLTNCFRITDPETGTRYLAEVGIEISDLELRKDAHRTLRELGIARREANRNEVQRLRDEAVFRIGRLRDELRYVKERVTHDLEVFVKVSIGKARTEAEGVFKRESARIAAEYKAIDLELENIKLRCEAATSVDALHQAEQLLGADPSAWTDRLRQARES
jgi:PAS domain S-box-containing protein